MLSRTLLFLAATLCLHADPGDELVEKIYAKLAAAFASARPPGHGGEHLILANPGVTVSRVSCLDAYAISTLADQIPRPTRYFEPSGATCSTVYGTILETSEVTNFQNMADRQKALKARRDLYDRRRPGRPTQTYATYMNYQAAHDNALDALNLARTEQVSMGKPVPPELEGAVTAALKNWETYGFKKQIEADLAALDAFYNENVKALFQGLENDFTVTRMADGHPTPWYPVTATPPPWEWLAEKDWKPFTITQAEKSLAGGPGILGPGLKAGAKPPPDLAATATLALETKRVTLTRPWLDMGIFKGRGWRLNPRLGFSTVSTGHPSDPDPGLMPLIITGVLLARRFMLTGRWQPQGDRGLAALGPFALAGSEPRRQEDGVVSITADGPQIIGFFCTSVPKSPDPDAKAFRTP
jgi:hypothetical protein